MKRRIAAFIGALGLATIMIGSNAPGAAAIPVTPITCTAHPGVTASGDNVTFSGFIRCDPYVKNGKILVLAYEGDSESQKFKERTETRCSLDESRCDGTPISRPNTPGPQTYCSYVEAFIGTTSKTVEHVSEKFCQVR